jgi:hypothetical protein
MPCKTAACYLQHSPVSRNPGRNAKRTRALVFYPAPFTMASSSVFSLISHLAFMNREIGGLTSKAAEHEDVCRVPRSVQRRPTGVTVAVQGHCLPQCARDGGGIWNRRPYRGVHGRRSTGDRSNKTPRLDEGGCSKESSGSKIGRSSRRLQGCASMA